MDYLLDSNILIRFVKPSDPDHLLVRTALQTLRLRGDRLCYILCFTP
jgi:hypothetical protein